MKSWEESLLEQIDELRSQKTEIQKELRELEIENTALRKRNADLEESLRYALLHGGN